MPIILAVLLFCGVLALCFGPAIWTKRILQRNGQERADFPGTGGELASHLLEELSLPDVRVEETEEGKDHYDPNDKAVRLGPKNMHGRSLTAVVTAAHEVGHAIQDRDDDAKLRRRNSLTRLTAVTDRIGIGAMVLSPFAGLMTGIPALTLLLFLSGFMSTAIKTNVHLATLPVEWDASFNKALPILEGGGYLPPEDMPEANRILKACAFTYVAAALNSLLNVTTWLRALIR